MSVLATILLLMLQSLPWGELLKLALGLIRKQAPAVESGEKSGEQAEAENIAAMKTATAMSPGISTGPLKFIHAIAWLLHVQIDKPDKFQKYEQELTAWQASIGSKSYDDPTVNTVYDSKFGYMDLYDSRPDSKR